MLNSSQDVEFFPRWTIQWGEQSTSTVYHASTRKLQFRAGSALACPNQNSLSGILVPFIFFRFLLIYLLNFLREIKLQIERYF